jgi:hypothetical protein
LVDAPALGAGGFRPWRFESSRPHRQQAAPNHLPRPSACGRQLGGGLSRCARAWLCPPLGGNGARRWGRQQVRHLLSPPPDLRVWVRAHPATPTGGQISSPNPDHDHRRPRHHLQQRGRRGSRVPSGCARVSVGGCGRGVAHLRIETAIKELERKGVEISRPISEEPLGAASCHQDARRQRTPPLPADSPNSAARRRKPISRTVGSSSDRHAGTATELASRPRTGAAPRS